MKKSFIAIGIVLLFTIVVFTGCLQESRTRVYMETIPPRTYMLGDAIFFFGNAISGVWTFMMEYPTESQSIASWYWDFGDGSTSDEQNPNHTYNSEGTYAVTVEATSEKGVKGQRTYTIEVKELTIIELIDNMSYSSKCGTFYFQSYNITPVNNSNRLVIYLEYTSPYKPGYQPPQQLFLTFRNTTMYYDYGTPFWGQGITRTVRYYYYPPEDSNISECQLYFYDKEEGNSTKILVSCERIKES